MLVFPTRLFKPQAVSAYLAGAVQTGGRSLGGTSQVGELSGGGLWTIEFGPVSLWDRELLMSWRALEGALENGVRPVIVPLGDRRHAPVTPKLATTPFDDLSLWDDAVTWANAEVEAQVTAAAALRATTLTFDYAAPKPLIGGERFSILHGANKGWRMYEVIEVTAGGAGTDDATTVKFRPPLRAAVAVDTPLNFDSPRCVCRLAGSAAAPLEMLRFGGSPGIAFVETFPESLA